MAGREIPETLMKQNSRKTSALPHQHRPKSLHNPSRESPKLKQTDCLSNDTVPLDSWMTENKSDWRGLRESSSPSSTSVRVRDWRRTRETSSQSNPVGSENNSNWRGLSDSSPPGSTSGTASRSSWRRPTESSPESSTYGTENSWRRPRDSPPTSSTFGTGINSNRRGPGEPSKYSKQSSLLGRPRESSPPNRTYGVESSWRKTASAVPKYTSQRASDDQVALARTVGVSLGSHGRSAARAVLTAQEQPSIQIQGTTAEAQRVVPARQNVREVRVESGREGAARQIREDHRRGEREDPARQAREDLRRVDREHLAERVDPRRAQRDDPARQVRENPRREERAVAGQRGDPGRGQRGPARGGRGGRGGGRGRPRGMGGQAVPRGGDRGVFADDDVQQPHRPRREYGTRKMGFRKLEELAHKQDPTEVLLSISAAREGFWNLIDSSDSIQVDWIMHVLQILQTAFTCTSSAIYIQCLNNVRSSKLLSQHVGSFFMQLMSQPPMKQRRMLISVQQYLEVCQCMLEKMPNCSDEILMSLTSLHYVIERLRKESELIDESLNTQLNELMKRCEDRTARNAQRAKRMNQSTGINADDLAPPDDFREADVFPSLQDLTVVDKPFLRANKVEGAYRGVEHYLDVQFRLLREDFIQPLRKGIHEYLKLLEEGGQVRRLQDLRLYHDVRILYPVCNRNGLSYRLRFDTKSMGKVRWESSKRLIYGSLVCLSKDDFQTMRFATVVNREVKALAEGEVEVQFEHNLEEVSNIGPDESFLMAETTAFFEAYRHVLNALKTIDEDSFPFKDYIVDCKTETDLPRYLQENSEIDLSPLFDDSIQTDCQDASDSSETEDSEDDLDRSVLERIRHREKEQKRQIKRKQKELLQKVPRCLKHVNVNSKVWPSPEDIHLDSSQLQALKAGLTQEFAIIQGPPGTGKTYLGLKIAKTLLHNRNLWKAPRRMGVAAQPSPILVVCYTNHALDQFLEGIAQFQTEGIVRVGGRSKSEVLKKSSIAEWRRNVRENRKVPEHARHLFYDAREEMERLDAQMSSVLTQIDVADRGILHEDILQNVMSDEHFSSILAIRTEVMHSTGKKNRKRASGLPEWLGVGAFVFEHELPPEENQPNPDEEETDEELEIEEENQFTAHQRMTDEDFNHLQDVKKEVLRKERIQLQANEQLAFQLEALDLNGHDDQHGGQKWEITKAARKKNKKRIKQELRKSDAMTHEEVRRVRNLSRLSYTERWRLYRYWLSEYKNHLRQSIHQSERQYQDASERMKTAKDHEDMYIMENAVVIGMTTTCAARCHNILQQVKPKIIIVEEAAEVLEAHIVTTLSDGCEHLILIGDHQQLRPNPTVYELAEKYSLKISLFERMINNGQNVITLENQHRMRPEISSVMLHIYPHLKDHSSVLNYDQIRGVQSSMFFINHMHPEMGDEELKSKANDFEARYIAKLCKYFLLQGYQPSQITILTPYTGQLFQLRRYMPRKSFQGVRVCAVDNFQGEENDIVLLSLVRSNSDGKLGFLSEDNRVCVLLSRAKMGFYVVGNISMLADKTALWANVVHTLKSQNMIGPSLGLYCSNHPDKKIDAKDAKDFEKAPEGGCLEPCRFRLECGHACALVCHPYDKDHVEYQCRKRCPKIICPRGHKCPDLCYETCNDCMVPVRRVIPRCSHIQDVPCYIEAEDFSCREKCEVKLPCGHYCDRPCGEPRHTVRCMERVQKLLPCGHKEYVECHRDPKEYSCRVPCNQPLSCDHPCTGTCGGCFNGRLHKACSEDCNRVLVCGHLCKTACPKACPPCKEKCQNACVHSKCHNICGMPCAPCTEPCTWRCRHVMTCSRTCSEPCDRERCNEPCMKRLRCEHPCIGMCGEKCPKLCRICNKDVVEEIFFGSEDEPGARFVELEDCGHIFEVEAMDHYMDLAEDIEQGKEVIQMKKCPRCSVVIRRNLRYGQVIKAILADIETVKQKIVGSMDNPKRKQRQLQEEVDGLPDCEFLVRLSMSLERRSLTPEELNVVENLIAYHKALEQAKKSAGKYLGQQSAETRRDEIFRQIQMLEHWLSSHAQFLRLSEQELNESHAEVTRIQLLTRAYKLYYYVNVKTKTQLKDDLNRSFHGVIKKLLKEALTKEREDECREVLKKVEKEASTVAGLGITNDERIQIVSAMGLTRGHWFKCPKGHVYAIGECGGATMEGKCPECGSTIGGTGHALRPDNALAAEMDGAPYAAWSEQANLQNYEL